MVEKSDDSPLTCGPRKEYEVPRVEIFYGVVVGDKGVGMSPMLCHDILFSSNMHIYSYIQTVYIHTSYNICILFTVGGTKVYHAWKSYIVQC